ncbi:hypothetical protein, partial [Acidovorax sp. SD340]|uniref:hypothetical protein n=1 Tax=Acidovorax sp. SD340 TaxID=1690268 RepID=UPI001A977510
ALPLARIRNVACSAFYEVENFWETPAVRYFSSLLGILNRQLIRATCALGSSGAQLPTVRTNPNFGALRCNHS